MTFPRLDPVGLDGLLVRFGDTLSEPANRAALAFKATLTKAVPDGVEEVATSLVSTYLRFDPVAVSFDDLARALEPVLAQRDWYAAELPTGRQRHEIPTSYTSEHGPQLVEAAQMAGLDPKQAVEMLSTAVVRVNAIGFAPGQPYLGTLPETWDIPRQAGLTPKVPAGALVVAIRQFVLFSVSAPTGWRQVGLTRAPLFRPDKAHPFLLRPGDEVCFPSVSRDVFNNLDAQGGVTSQVLT